MVKRGFTNTHKLKTV